MSGSLEDDETTDALRSAARVGASRPDRNAPAVIASTARSSSLSGVSAAVLRVFSGLDHRRLLLVVLFAAIFSFDFARETDIDFWWHLRTGELIARSGSVPTMDPFSYTAFGSSWVAHEWLWELAIYWIYQQGGYVLAVLVSALIVTLTYMILYRLLRRLGANEILSGALVLWAAVLALPCIGVRPRELTHLFFALYLSCLLLYRAQRARHLWPLPLVMALWVNLHGAFVLGLVLLALFIAGETLERLLAREGVPRRLLAVGAATVAAAIINPQGPQRLLYPFGYYLAKQNPSLGIVTEFQSPNFHQPMSLLFAAGIVLLMLLGLRRGRRQVVEGLLAVFFTLQGLVSVRQVSVCALVMAPVLAAVLCERFAWARLLPPPRLPRRLIALNWMVLLLLVFAGMVFAAGPRVARKLQLGMEPKAGSMSVAGAQFIEQNHLPDQVFNEQGWGGYLIYRWYPERKVFIDGRVDMYGAEIVHEYLQVATVKPEWESVLDKYGVRTVLTGKQSAVSVLLAASGGWERVFQGEVEEVFVRRDSNAPP
jgi:hypothetical protein